MAVAQTMGHTDYADAWYICGAPTHNQAKRIFWRDLKALSPRNLVTSISESELTIRYWNGAELTVMGMDVPERLEGRALNGIVLDEYAKMRERTWEESVRPALADRQGWAWFVGVPRGRNHYYTLVRKAMADKSGDWKHFTWMSADILPASEIDAARRDMDPLTFQQEFEADFLNFEGRIYYAFDQVIHCKQFPLPYDKYQPLRIGLDFNYEPGVATIMQEHSRKDWESDVVSKTDSVTCAIGEVFIPRHSNTEIVCRKILKDWGDHPGEVHFYGDATGGAKGSAKIKGSDWDIVKNMLKPHFQTRLKFRVPDGNPRERARINSFNTRLLNAAGEVRFLVDPERCPNLINDLEGVVGVPGGSGEIMKDADSMLTHISDGVGYYIAKRFPVRISRTSIEQVA